MSLQVFVQFAIEVVSVSPRAHDFFHVAVKLSNLEQTVSLERPRALGNDFLPPRGELRLVRDIAHLKLFGIVL